MVSSAQTTDATATILVMLNGTTGSLLLVDKSAVATYERTMIVRGRVVARRIDTPGTDSAWSFQGVLRGNGSSAYSWVGGAAPTATLIAQDVAAATWTVTIAMDGGTPNQLDVTVTGEVSKTLNWECTLELDEIAG